MTSNPWYREPWPWFIMAGPAIVVVAGIATAVIAARSFDGLVADDHYKQGLAVNRVIARETAATRLGVVADVAFSPERTRLRVTLSGGDAPASLRMALVHPTLSAEDQSVLLARVVPGVYQGAMRPPRLGPLQLRLEDGEGRWRLSGAWATMDDALRLAP